MDHRYKAGQRVRFSPGGGKPDRGRHYEVTRQLPVGDDGEHHYRIKNLQEQHERVANALEFHEDMSDMSDQAPICLTKLQSLRRGATRDTGSFIVPASQSSLSASAE
jgi:hypothetical protein